MKKNQKKSSEKFGGARIGAGRKKGSVAIISRRVIIEALKKDQNYYVEKLVKWLDSDSEKLQIFAWEQIYGKAPQSIELGGIDGKAIEINNNIKPTEDMTAFLEFQKKLHKQKVNKDFPILPE